MFCRTSQLVFILATRPAITTSRISKWQSWSRRVSVGNVPNSHFGRILRFPHGKAPSTGASPVGRSCAYVRACGQMEIGQKQMRSLSKGSILGTDDDQEVKGSERTFSTRTAEQNVDDLLFDMLKEKEDERVVVGKFLAALEETGLRRTDLRLSELIDSIVVEHNRQQEASQGEEIYIKTMRIDRATFKQAINANIVLLSRAFSQQMIIPEFKKFCNQVEEMFNKCREEKGGQVASYIPQLARADPNHWGLSLCTTDGQRYSVGDSDVAFTIQSCSKPISYTLALNELGPDTVHQYVGQEPSGRMFNELILDYNHKPHNPMVNAGAIIVCSLLKMLVHPEMSAAEKFDYVQNYFKAMAGGEYVGFNNAVFLSEREEADRNFALGYYMKEHNCFPEGVDLKKCLDFYFQSCSLEATCESASVIAATMANGGICPISGEVVAIPEAVNDTLALMRSCGMYDYSGQFEFSVGIPAKSGVSGAILVVVPNVLGMAMFSPPLDMLGNSVRGLKFCHSMVQMFNFHNYDNLRYAMHKIDPRKKRSETKGLNIVNLLFCAASGDVRSVRRHHLCGMDMGAQDYDGRTALHLAAAEGRMECVEYLLELCKVSSTVKDRWGRLPVDDAEKFGHTEVATFLKHWASSHHPHP